VYMSGDWSKEWDLLFRGCELKRWYDGWSLNDPVHFFSAALRSFDESELRCAKGERGWNV
jgi:hypothetical protein